MRPLGLNTTAPSGGGREGTANQVPAPAIRLLQATLLNSWFLSHDTVVGGGTDRRVALAVRT
jgi:hypothetical protein